MVDTYHDRDIKACFSLLKTSEKGLSSNEAKKRLEKYGLNEIKEKKGISPVKIFISQFNSFIVYILIAALAVSILLGEKLDAIVIGAILIINAIMGFVQEYRAEKAIEALKKMASLKAVVIRNGEETEVDAAELVPGDIIVLETGEKIPADSRLIEVVNLQTQEAALTGESLPIKKDVKALVHKTAVADRKNMVMSGTIITNGRGKAVVAGTGMNTEIGKIAEMIQETKEKPTHLQLKLKVLGEWLGIATIGITIVVFLVGWLIGGMEPIEIFIAAVALAVAAIPEGLPAVVTISLALGVQRMVKKNALIRKLPSVETLGATNVICTDKTGTLTKNEMTVRKVYANGRVIEVTGSGYEPKGVFTVNSKIVDPKRLNMLLKIGALCNDARLNKGEVIGDPTEGCLIVSAEKAGIIKKDIETKHNRLGEIGFTSIRKRMSTYHNLDGKKTVLCKGAPDVILELCDRILVNGQIHRLTRIDKKKILKVNEEFSNDALRVLGFAYKQSEHLDEKDLIFVGLQGMIDPPREEVKAAIAKCKKAGIRVVMITGDYIGTAKAVGKEIGIEGRALTGHELDSIKDLDKEIENIGICARVDPAHKVKILEALKAKGYVVAMTGDGVNDAPALKKADIGVAMGITGTDVAKEASDMILTDDNFASIVNAIEEGRGIFENIKKFVEYLLSSNLGEILTIFIAIIIGMPLPLIAIMILWINLLTDGPPALALSVDPADPNIMSRKPKAAKERILSGFIIRRMIMVGIIMAAGTLGVFKFYLNDSLAYAQTAAFATLMFFQMFNVLNCRSERSSLFKVGIFSNKYLLWAILGSILLQIAVIHTPLSMFFKTVPLTPITWFYTILVSATVFVFVELGKWFMNVRESKG